MKEQQGQECAHINLYGFSEFRGVEVRRSHQHGQRQLLKISSQLRFQVTDQILTNGGKQREEDEQIHVNLNYRKHSKSDLPIGSFVGCNQWNPLLVGAASQKFNDGVFISSCSKHQNRMKKRKREKQYSSAARCTLTEALHRFSKNLNIPQWIGPRIVLDGTPVALLQRDDIQRRMSL